MAIYPIGIFHLNPNVLFKIYKLTKGVGRSSIIKSQGPFARAELLVTVAHLDFYEGIAAFREMNRNLLDITAKRGVLTKPYAS
ncbi:hypothetical protein ES703_49056 [subsurface metagenome]